MQTQEADSTSQFIIVQGAGKRVVKATGQSQAGTGRWAGSGSGKVRISKTKKSTGNTMVGLARTRRTGNRQTENTGINT